jgi:Tfp pilus assembly protein PilF
MGHVFWESGDYDHAGTWYRKAIDAKPQDATYHIFLGALLEKPGRLHDAEQCFRTATSCQEGCIDEAFFMLGLVLRDQGAIRRSGRVFGRAKGHSSF